MISHNPLGKLQAKAAFGIATLFGTGYLSGFPGTVGSVFGLLLYVITGIIGGAILQWIFFPILIILAYWSGKWVADSLGQKDPTCVVIDEVAGVWVTFLGTHIHGPFLLIGFLLFRLMDIFKPFPIRRSEAIPKGWGILVDDLLAGLYANLVLRLILNLL